MWSAELMQLPRMSVSVCFKTVHAWKAKTFKKTQTFLCISPQNPSTYSHNQQFIWYYMQSTVYIELLHYRGSWCKDIKKSKNRHHLKYPCVWIYNKHTTDLMKMCILNSWAPFNISLQSQRVTPVGFYFSPQLFHPNISADRCKNDCKHWINDAFEGL